MRANIEAERGRKRIPKYKLSRMLGISQETYNRYINGENSIPSDVLVNMRNIFGCSIDYLLGVIDERQEIS
jgi:transcriptional regulator with XRE-family HTH domain|nr:MAG TPA: helix-turn-helix protein [Caudoviricetes sp.]